MTDIFSIQNANQFNEYAFETFRFQYLHNEVYQQFCSLIKVNPNNINTIEQIPFLPIDFFKSHQIITKSSAVQTTFLSSGTTGNSQSKHLVADLELYQKSYTKGFEYFYGNISDYVILALLPSYLEREGSSLIYMVEDLIKKTAHTDSGFYLYNHEELANKLTQLEQKKQKTLLIGVPYALLDFLETYSFRLKNTIVMETGGMKGKRKELIRAELHQILCQGFGTESIHSEYGMTELLSQAYSKGNGVFDTPPWMKILIRDTQNPLENIGIGKTGGINVIDLANRNSCSFIATQDLGRKHNDTQFEVLGRFDHSQIRGCNLMIV
ncbi:MAG: acyl transferase [Bacteroidota bacterium]|nr:acyl transferase [Bacteroidota bacterium]